MLAFLAIFNRCSVLDQLSDTYGSLISFVLFIRAISFPDYSRLVDHYMRLGLYKEALDTFISEPSCLDRMYEHAITLVGHEPERAVEVWLRLGKRLNPTKLA